MAKIPQNPQEVAYSYQRMSQYLAYLTWKAGGHLEATLDEWDEFLGQVDNQKYILSDKGFYPGQDNIAFAIDYTQQENIVLIPDVLYKDEV